MKNLPFHELDIRHLYVEVDKAPLKELKRLMFDQNYVINEQMYNNVLFSKNGTK